MALLVIDPQGEFSKDLLGQASGGFALPLGDVLSKFKKPFYVMTVRQLVLDTWELFEEIIYESQFFERLTMPRGENRRLAASILVEKLQKKKVKLKDLHTRDAFDTAWSLLKDQKVQVVFYRTESSRKRFNTTLEEADPDEFYKNYWVPVAELFREDRKGAATVDRALSWLLDLESNNRPVLVIDLSKEKAEGLFWDEKIQALVIKRLLDGINYNAERYYKNNQSLNALVIIDEAHRLAPRDLPKEEEAARQVRRVLIDTARTTRKYGLGWLFISQTLSSIHTEIIQQLRIFFFGFGLGLGQEFQALRQLVGSSGSALDLYQLFRDPHSAFDVSSRQYSFMTIGPVSPLSFAGTPLFFNAFNTVDAFFEANDIKVPVRENGDRSGGQVG